MPDETQKPARAGAKKPDPEQPRPEPAPEPAPAEGAAAAKAPSLIELEALRSRLIARFHGRRRR